MAEAIFSPIAEEILKKLGSRALQEVGLWWYVKDELDKLKRTVFTIKAVLGTAEKQPTMSDQVKNLVENLKEIVYDADDLLDDFSTEALRRQVMSGNKMVKEVRIFFSPSNQLVYGLKMGHKIKAIRETLDAIKADKEFHIGEGTTETQVEAQFDRETDSFIPSEDVIGRDDDKKEIIKLLLGSNFEENVMIIPIVGIGGLGKTTLAQFVYNDDEVKNGFELKLWVVVSDVFNVKAIVKKIIQSATNEEPKNLELDELQMRLRKELDGKKYLLVLDDVWNEELIKWLNLKKYLMGGAWGSRILVTTRSQGVADITSRVSPYILKELSKKDSWSLFVKMAFREEPTDQNIVAIGKEIVNYCAGVPLAIRAMGSMFKSKKLEHEWTSSKIELSELVQQGGSILSTLKLSYNNLKPHLKHCFAYCSLFPKDCEIDVKKLIYLWIGQSFIKSSPPSQTLEQIGYADFLFLLRRCFFQEPKKDEWGNIKGCKMHDLMHELAVEVAGEESTLISSTDKNVPKNTRHVSIDYNHGLPEKIPDPLLEANKIRTFLLTKGLWSVYEETWSRAIVSKFKCLRTLDLHGLGITRVPYLIGKLKHLRYLDLSNNYSIEMLPSSIARLQNLLVLKLSNCKMLKELPKDIKQLVSLTYLEIDGCIGLTHMPQGLGQLTSLQKLATFIVSNDHSVVKHCGGLNELKRLNNLRGELSLKNLNHVKYVELEYKGANLEGKEHLQSLILHWGDTVDDAMSMEGLQPHRNLKELHVSHYPAVKFPSWLSSLTNLVDLEIHDCKRVKYLPRLDELSSLQYLFIKDLIDLEYIECNLTNYSRAMFFSSLKTLKINKCPNLKGWRVVSSTTAELPPFPCLSKLEIRNCKSLTLMPLFPSIEGDLYLYYTSGKPLQQTMMMKSNAASSSTSSSFSPPFPLSKLKFLHIYGLEDLEYLPDQGMENLTSLENLKIEYCHGLLNLEGKGFRGLTSLSSLYFFHCYRLKSISGVFQHCTALKNLYMEECWDLDISDGMQWQELRSLSSLDIRYLPKLVFLSVGLLRVTTLKYLNFSHCTSLQTLSPIFDHLIGLEELDISWCDMLDFSKVGIQSQNSWRLRVLSLAYIPRLLALPDWLQHFTTLQVLKIASCNNFTTLPDWIGNLTSLQQLEITCCSKLTSLPEGMLHLTALQKFSIWGCPQLSERCRNNIGEDWHKIAHVPNIETDGTKIE